MLLFTAKLSLSCFKRPGYSFVTHAPTKGFSFNRNGSRSASFRVSEKCQSSLIFFIVEVVGSLFIGPAFSKVRFHFYGEPISE